MFYKGNAKAFPFFVFELLKVWYSPIRPLAVMNIKDCSLMDDILFRL